MSSLTPEQIERLMFYAEQGFLMQYSAALKLGEEFAWQQYGAEWKEIKTAMLAERNRRKDGR